ncbi:MAG: hypothetical protein SFW09_18365 [Hyphomicrobiaceae bacterium]|nr:hypothetical protein [Hyphomicrobiaceae bacterium]
MSPSAAPIIGRHLTPALVMLLMPIAAWAQAPTAPSPWPADIELRRGIPPPGAPVGPPRQAPRPPAPEASWGTSSTPAKPAPPPEIRREAAAASVTLTAHLTQDGEQIDQGLVWRVFTEPPKAEAEARPTQPGLVGTWRDPAPVVQLPPGAYVINVAYGRAHLTRKVTIAEPRPLEERFVLNAGGLRVTVALTGGEKPPDTSVSYDVYQGDTDQLGARTKIVAGLRPGVIVRLNAGLFHIVSTVGDANATVSADVTVEAGKLTDAVLTHHAARVTLKLVTRAGGEAQADTQWSVHSIQGDLVRETQGALPTHILAAGQYVASARHGGRLYQRQFTVTAGEPAQVEVVMK